MKVTEKSLRRRKVLSGNAHCGLFYANMISQRGQFCCMVLDASHSTVLWLFWSMWFSLQFNSWPKSFLSSRNSLFTGPCEYWAKFLAPSSFGQKTTPCKKNSKGKHFSNIKAKSVFEFDSPTIFWQKCPDFKSNHPDSILPFGLLMQLSSKTLCTHSITCKFICSCIHLMSTFRCTCNLS